MLNDILLIIGSVIIIGWGIGHLKPTRNIVGGFGELSADNLRLVTMEWIVEGLTLIFIGVLVLLVTLLSWSKDPTAIIVYLTSAGFLVILAILSQLTAARTNILPMKYCPYVKTGVALLFFLASVL